MTTGPEPAVWRTSFITSKDSFARVVIVLATAGLVFLSFINAPYPEELILQHVPTLPALAVLIVVNLRYSPSRCSFLCAMAFLWIHILGARWIYSFVPYDDWIRSISGTSLSESFGWERNHYDRFVHFAFGVLGVPIASEILQRRVRVAPSAAALLGIALVLSVGALYEILEWQLAVHLSPAHAESYNGQQGDVWDPQKDQALAWIGAMLSALLCLRWDVGATKRTG